MQKQHASLKIAKYATVLTLSGIVCKVLLIGFVYLAANGLGKALYGRLEYLIEFGLILSVLFDFGFEQTVTRDLAGRPNRAREVIWGFAVYRCLLGFGLFATYVLVLRLFFLLTGRPVEWGPIVLGGLVTMVMYHIALSKAVLRSQERLGTEAWMNLADKVVNTGLGSIAVVLGFGLAVVVSTYLAGALVALVMGVVALHRVFPRLVHRFEPRTALSWQRTGAAIGLSAGCLLLLHREDTIMVNIISGDAATGIYRAPYRYFEGLFLIPQMLAVSSYPVLSSMIAQKRPVQGIASDLLRFLLVLAIPMAVGGTVLGADIIETLLPPPEYPPMTSAIFMILVWSLPPIFLNFILGTLLNAAHRQRRNFQAAAVALIGNFVLNIPAILWYEGLGAAVVTILSQGMYCVMCLWWARDLLVLDKPRVWTCVAALLASAIMGGTLLWVDLAWWWEVPLGAVIYLAGIVVLRAFSPSDVRRLRGILSRASDGPG